MGPARRSEQGEDEGPEDARLMEERRANNPQVPDAEGRLVGALSSNDLMGAKVI